MREAPRNLQGSREDCRGSAIRYDQRKKSFVLLSRELQARRDLSVA